jgi:membrane-anchored glycerophosphoryl diester phosphodiesterase (GDPDase)
MNTMLFQSLFMPEATTPIFPDSALAVFYLFLKVIFVLAAILYIIFSFVVVRQIHLMRSTIITPFSAVIQIVGYLHLLLAFSVLFLFIAIL